MKLRSAADDITVTHFGGASIDFLADMLVNKIDYPSIRVIHPGSKYPAPTVGASLQAIVLSIRRETKQCFGDKTILKMVLFDGSNNCFKAVTDTLLSETLPDVKRGSRLSISEYSWIKLSSNSSFKHIRIMLITELETSDPPSCEGKEILIMEDPDDNLFGMSPDQLKANTTSFHPDIVKKCHGTGEIVFTCAECLYDPKTNAGFVYCGPAKRWQLASGAPVATRFLKPDFKRLFTVGLADSSDDDSTVMYCECMSRFQYVCCGRFTFSITMMDKDLLFDQMIAKVPEDKRLAKCWDDLEAPKQRWCFYHWVHRTCTILLRGRSCLPVVQYVREKIPNDNEQQAFTGYVPRFYTHQSIMSPMKADTEIHNEEVEEQGTVKEEVEEQDTQRNKTRQRKTPTMVNHCCRLRSLRRRDGKECFEDRT
ncbi:hypothetical protein SEMRO_460_G147500.1 [Seminavis robusta]|uniref:Uncharacterized protein n=1 Tax=Seminavis robusta TaxID=568900 RepID=A0A9N8DY94_9STRA|nr:hypothetical protein SEMRO_460_G147500.1 [Seminavis robusta]|eukprot:Sro460_g147500.1 n/a (424) ;mRNA; r:30949-32220